MGFSRNGLHIFKMLRRSLCVTHFLNSFFQVQVKKKEDLLHLHSILHYYL